MADANHDTIQEIGVENILLQASDDEVFQVDKNLLMGCAVLRTMLEHPGVGPSDDHIVPLPLDSKTMYRVLSWMQFHYQSEEGLKKCKGEDEKCLHLESVDTWEKEYFTMEDVELLNVIQASDFLDAATLYDAATNHIAHVIETTGVKELRKRFIVRQDLKQTGEQSHADAESETLDYDLQDGNEENIDTEDQQFDRMNLLNTRFI